MWRIILETVLLVAVLVSASVHDVRSREVPDIHWVAAGAATVLGHWYLAPDIATAVLASAGTLSVLACTVRDLPDRIVMPFGIALMLACILLDYGEIAVTLAMTASFLAMYRLGMIRGGADTKALMVVAMAFPAYPELPGLPLVWEPCPETDAVLNFPAGTLALSLLMSLVGGALMMAAANVRDGNVGTGMFSTLRVPLEKADGGFYWPLEDACECEDGHEVFRIRVGKDDPGTIGRLRAAGATDVLVTPMIPFLVPITAAVLFILLLGNPLFMS